METSPSLEALYASTEVSEAYERGKRDALREHRCPKVEVKTKIIERARKPHPRSRELKYGIVSNGQLLNPTYATRHEAEQGLLGLVPANRVARDRVKIDAMVIKLK